MKEVEEKRAANMIDGKRPFGAFAGKDETIKELEPRVQNEGLKWRKYLAS